MIDYENCISEISEDTYEASAALSDLGALGEAAADGSGVDSHDDCHGSEEIGNA